MIVLFDLDGTISDSAPGILSSLRHAFAVNGIAPLDAATERSLLGPPFYTSLPPLVGEDRVAPVIAAYRARYETAMFDTTVYAGVPELLAALRRAGHRLAVATSKPEHFAVPIIERLGLADCFEVIGGDDLAGTLRTKALVIGSVLQRLGSPDVGAITMVGDRSHDVVGAREHGIDCLGVRWGYGLPGELEAARPARICATPNEVGDALGVDVDVRA